MIRVLRCAALACLFVFASLNLSAQQEEPKYYQIRNVKSGKVLAVVGGAKGDGEKIVQVPFTQAAKKGLWEKQQWQIIQVDTEVRVYQKDNRTYRLKVPYYKIVNRKSGKVLDVLEKSKEDGVQLEQWGYKGGENQHWYLEKRDKHWVIKARHSGKVVDVFGGSMQNGGKIVQWAPNDSPNQTFDLVPVK